MFVVTGVTGNTGSVAANELLAQNKQVRVVVRDTTKGQSWASKGAQVAVASFDDTASLTKAFEGAEGVYVLLPPFGWTEANIAEERKRLTASVLAALTAAKPKHVVFLSSVGAQHTDGTGPIKYLNPIENALKNSGIASTFLRASFFQENWLSMVGGAISAGALYYGAQHDKKFSQVATHDIGLTAARLLLDPISSGTRVVELGGPEDLSLDDTAKAISLVSGKEIKAVQVPVEATIGALMGQGASQAVAEIYTEMVDGLNKGIVTWEHPESIVRGKTTLVETLKKALSK